jgi:DNA-binding transcriptional MerR regulator
VTDHLSIGEVLSLLQDEFPDITISKIRFLESQGLIDPERTPSGYRKFYEADIDRLRWILIQQREHFLPLKVIKDRLGDSDGGGQDALPLGGTPSDPPAAPMRDEVDGVGEAGVASNGHQASDGAEPEAELADLPVASADLGTAASSDDGADAAHSGEDAPQPIWMVDLARANAATKATAAAEVASKPLHADSGPTEVSLTARELAQAAGISMDDLRSLEQYGLLTGRRLGDDVFYDGDALLVATKAAGFLRRGVEARHLRMFKVAAEREAGFLEQLAMPLLKQRNPQARRDAVEMVEELSALGHDLRSVLLRANLRQHLDST